MKKLQVFVAGTLAGISAGILAFAVYLIFIFPKKVAVWDEQGAALSLLQRSMLSMSDLCKSLGLLILPALLLALVGCLVWAFLAGRSRHE